jgi:SAM-dependent methyltransferase
MASLALPSAGKVAGQENFSVKGDLKEREEQERALWESCAKRYEDLIVQGHPDIRAAEALEEEWLGHLLRKRAGETSKEIHVVEAGCGSARVLVQLAAAATEAQALGQNDRALLQVYRRKYPEGMFHAGWAQACVKMLGVDFSRSMLDLADERFLRSGLSHWIRSRRARLIHGSAFDLPETAPGQPWVICLLNSIGVMQGEKGARALLRSVRKAAGNHGVGFISAYRAEAMATHGLGQYESTLEVAGIPEWLEGDLPEGCRARIRSMIRAGQGEVRLPVDWLDSSGIKVGEGELRRNADRVKRVCETGEVVTRSGYRSRWYPWSQIAQMVREEWGEAGWQMSPGGLDRLRGASLQWLWFDPTGWIRKSLG